MDTEKNMRLARLALLAVIVISGCSDYGKLKNQPPYGEQVTIQDLVENLNDYTVYYSGYAVNNPSGILFDPKDDNKILVLSNRWIKFEAQEEVLEVVSWIKIQDFPHGYPGLYRILGLDNEVYGYLFTGWNHLVAKSIDKKTLFVYDLPPPPHYYGPGGTKRGGGG
jgi:hypothetical protein